MAQNQYVAKLETSFRGFYENDNPRGNTTLLDLPGCFLYYIPIILTMVLFVFCSYLPE